MNAFKVGDRVSLWNRRGENRNGIVDLIYDWGVFCKRLPPGKCENSLVNAAYFDIVDTGGGSCFWVLGEILPLSAVKG